MYYLLENLLTYLTTSWHWDCSVNDE